jgi:anti-sigma regulatory factor (Ser/Thr protein kinase)
MSGGLGAVSNDCSAHDHPRRSGHPPFSQWRLASRLEFGPLPSAVPCVRLHARHIFSEWGLAHIADDAELIVSELMTNALNATKLPHGGLPITLQLLVSCDYLLIQVWDALSAAPTPRPHAIDSETGRGLEIVSLLTDQWGYYLSAEGGKAVWAALIIGAAPSAAQGAVA